MLRRFIRSGIDRALSPSLNRLATTVREQARTSPETKIGQRLLFHFYRNLAATGAAPRLRDTGFRVVSQLRKRRSCSSSSLRWGFHQRLSEDTWRRRWYQQQLCEPLRLNFGSPRVVAFHRS